MALKQNICPLSDNLKSTICRIIRLLWYFFREQISPRKGCHYVLDQMPLKSRRTDNHRDVYSFWVQQSLRHLGSDGNLCLQMSSGRLLGEDITRVLSETLKCLGKSGFLWRLLLEGRTDRHTMAGLAFHQLVSCVSERQMSKRLWTWVQGYEGRV